MSNDRRIQVYPFPEGEPQSEDFSVFVDGTPVGVYCARVSAAPINQVWPGYQRPLDQTELASFVYWDMAGEVTVKVVSRRPVESVAVKPSSRCIVLAVEGDTITFTLSRPGALTVEVNGTHHALHLFANPFNDYGCDRSDPKVHYYGPGVHQAGKMTLRSGETLFIDGGAVVYGALEVKHASDIRILGRGILDTSGFGRDEASGCISLYNCQDVRIDGVILRDPNVWTLIPAHCEHVDIHNVKLVGLWRYNADGIDVVNSRHVRIADCFIRSFDDSIVLKGLKGWAGDPTDDQNLQDVHVSGCVIWCDWGRALELGAETCADDMSDIVFEDCDVIRTTMVALDLQHGDRALVHDVRFENIRFEIDDYNPRPLYQTHPGQSYEWNLQDDYCPGFFVIEINSTMWSQDKANGSARQFVVKDVSITGKPFPTSKVYGLDAEHTVEGIVFENIRHNGEPIRSAEACRLSVGPYASNVRFAEEG